jgi:hypothetical protein
VRTYAEQVAGLTRRHGRRSALLTGLLESIALALAGRAGARLAEALGSPAGRSTLLRLIRALPDPPAGAVKVLGVDDFALRRRCWIWARAGRPSVWRPTRRTCISGGTPE